jgi:hypothetical protein
MKNHSGDSEKKKKSTVEGCAKEVIGLISS